MKPKKSAAKSTSVPEGCAVEEEKKPSSSTPKKARDEIEEIFAAKKRKRPDQENPKKPAKDAGASNSSGKTMKETKKNKSKKIANRESGSGFREPAAAAARSRKRTGEGIAVYTEEELGIGRADAGELKSLEPKVQIQQSNGFINLRDKYKSSTVYSNQSCAELNPIILKRKILGQACDRHCVGKFYLFINLITAGRQHRHHSFVTKRGCNTRSRSNEACQTYLQPQINSIICQCSGYDCLHASPCNPWLQYWHWNCLHWIMLRILSNLQLVQLAKTYCYL